MNTEVSTALLTLEADPRNQPALEALTRQAQVVGVGEHNEFAAALAAARILHTERGDLEVVVELLERELAVTTDARERAALLCEKARLLHDELCRAEAADAALQEALSLVNGFPDAAKLGKRFADEEAEWEKTAQTRVKQAKEAGGKAGAGAHWAAAGELFMRFRSKSGEGEAFLRRALEIEPKNRRADVLLERLLRADGKVDALAEFLDRRIGIVTTPDDKAAAEILAGQVAEARQRSAEAIDHFKKALQFAPGDMRALRAVVAPLTEAGNHAELAKVYEGALKSAKKGQGELSLLLPLVDLTWRKLNNLEQAELHVRRIKKIDPLHPLVLDFYKDFHEKRGEIPQLLALLGTAQKAEPDPERKIRLGIDMARIAESRPQSAEKAIDIWKGLLKLQPGLPDATAGLRALYTKTEKWNALLEMVKDAIEALPKTDTDAKVALYLEMIPIYRDRLRLDVMVSNTWAAILLLQPNHVDALRALAERHEAHGRWSDLVELLARQATNDADPVRKLELFRRVASLWSDKLGKPQNAVVALEKILQVDPRDGAARKALKDLHTRSRNFKAVLDVLRGEAELVAGSEKRALLGEMAALAADKLQDGKLAIGIQNQILELDVNDAAALVALESLYEKAERWPAMAEILGRRAATLSAQSAESAVLLEKRAQVLRDRMGAKDAALDTWTLLLASQPDNGRALRGVRDALCEAKRYDDLEALYAGRGAYEDLCDALSALADKLPEGSDATERTQVLLRVADLARKHLTQPDRAISAYEKLLVVDPRNLSTARALVAILSEVERWPRVVAVYESLLGGPDATDPVAVPGLDDEAYVGLLAEARRICEEKLGSKELGFKWARRLFDRAPQQVADFERLAGITNEWPAFADRVRTRLAVATGDEQVDLLRRLLRATLGPLGRRAEARSHAEALIKLTPGDAEAESALATIYQQEGARPELLALWRRQVQLLGEGEARIGLLVKIADLEEALGDRAAAKATLETVLSHRPDDEAALTTLGRVAEASGDWKTVVSSLRRRINRGQVDDPLAALLRLGRVQETELLDADEARMAYCEALDLDGVSTEAVAGLERLLEAKAIPEAEVASVLGRLLPCYEVTETYPKWAAALERLINLGEDPKEKQARLETLVDLYAGPAADKSKALSTALRLFDLNPRSFETRERLLTLAAAVAGFEDLSQVVRTVLKRTTERGHQEELLGYLATVEEKGPGGAGSAERVYRELLKLDPMHGGAFRALSAQFQTAARWTDLRDLLGVREQGLGEAAEKLKLLNQIVEIDESLLDDHAHAALVLPRLIELNPGDPKLPRSLERHLTALERWPELSAHLAAQTAVAKPVDAVELRMRRADLAHRKLSRTGDAIDLCEEILAFQPTHGGVRHLLEDVLPLDQHRRRAAVILESIYEREGDWAFLAKVLQVQAEDADAADESMGLWIQVAVLHESKLDDRAAALGVWKRVLSLETGAPTTGRALSEIERLSPLLDQHVELAALYQVLAQKQASGAANLAVAADLLGRSARLCLAVLGDRDAAIATFRKALDLDPSNPAVARPAAEALESLYGQKGDFRGYVHVLRLQIDWAEAGPARGITLRKIAEIEEKSLGDLHAAVATWRAIAEIEADAAGPLVELDRLHGALLQHRERVDVLRRLVELSPDAAGRETLRFRIAGLLERELSDLDEAVSSVLAVLDETPKNRAALQILASLYEKSGSTNERLEVLERQLVLATDRADKDEKAEILRRIAGILTSTLARPADALERWRDVLSLYPKDAAAMAALEGFVAAGDSGASESAALRVQAARVLEPLYEDANDFSKLARMIEISVTASDDAGERATLRARLSDLQETKLSDPKAAFATLALALRDATADAQLGRLLDAYERLADGLKEEGRTALVGTYADLQTDVLDEGLRLRMARGVARRIPTGPSDSARAVQAWTRVLGVVPDDLEALGAVEAIHRDSGSEAALVDVLNRRLDLLPAGSKDELDLRLEVGDLMLRLGRRDEAISAFERVWTLSPGHKKAGATLDVLYTEAEQWTELAGLVQRRLDLGSGEDDVLAVRVRLAQIHSEKRGDKFAAVAELGATLKQDPSYAPAAAGLEGLLGDEDVQVAAANLLESVYVRQGAWLRLVAIDEIRLKRSDDEDRRLGYVQRIARVYEEQIEDFDSAFTWYGRWFREQPNDRSAQEQLLRLAPKLNKWNELAALLDEHLEEETGNGDDVLELVRLSALIYDERLGDREKARKHYNRSVHAVPGDVRASRVFEAALERWQAYEELRDLLDEQAAQVSQVSDRISYLRRSAALSADRLNDRARAASSLRGILDIDPKNPGVVSDLEKLLTVDERWSDLREHLLWLLEHAGDMADPIGTSFRLAEVEELRLGEIGTAIDRYGEILTRSPRHAGALAGLERLLGNADHRLRVAQVLDPFYRRAQDVRKLGAVLEIELEAIVDVGPRVAILTELALIEERMGRLDRALEARGRAWLSDVASSDTLGALESVAVASRLYPRFVEILSTGARGADDPDLTASLWSMAAMALESRVGDPARAIEAWREVLAARLDDDQAFVSLERLLSSAGRYSELAEILEKHLEVARDGGQRKILQTRLALLFEETLKQNDKAIDAWRAVLELDDGDVDALGALVRLYGAGASWRDLAEIFLRQIERTRDAATLRTLRFQTARLLDEKLGEPIEASAQLQAIVQANPTDAEALVALDRLLSRDERHSELLLVLDRRMALAPNADDRAELGFRASDLLQHKLEDVIGAIERYRQVLEQAPGHEGSKRALLQLAQGQDYRRESIAAVEPVLRQAGAWAEVVDLLGLRLDLETTPALRFDLWRETATLRELSLHDPRGAFAAWSRAFAELPSESEPRAALERLATASSDFAALAAQYQERLDDNLEPALEAEIAWRLVELLENRLGDPAKAAELLSHLSEMSSEEPKALQRLSGILERMERFAELDDVLQRQAEIEPEASAQARALVHLGEVRRLRTDNAEGAVEAFKRALEREPENGTALASLNLLLRDHEDLRREILYVLEPLAEARADFADLVRLYELRAQGEVDRTERAAWLRRVADLAAEKLGNPAAAADALARALKADPQAGDVAEALEKATLGIGKPAQGAVAIESVLEEVSDMALVELGLRSARLFVAAVNAGESQFEPAAERLYLRVCKEDAENAEALAALDGLYRRQKDDTKLVAILEQRAAHEGDPTTRRQHYAEAARLRETLGDLPGAVAAWQAVREAEEGNAQALTELSRLHEQAGRHTELVAILEERATFSETQDERAALLRRVAALKAGPLNDKEGAASALRDALDAAPHDRAALAALQAIEAERGDHSAVEDVLLRHLGVALGDERIDVLFSLVANAETQLDDVDRAVGYLQQVREQDPDNARAFAAMVQIFERRERWHELIELLESRATVVATHDPDAELDIRLQIADIWGRRIGDEDSAREAIGRVLAKKPQQGTALLALAAIEERAEHWDEAASLLERAAAVAQTPQARAEVHHLRARVLNAQGAAAADIEACLRAALEADPKHLGALRDLCTRARAAGDDNGLAKLIEQELDAGIDGADRRSRLEEVAGLLTTKLGAPGRALPYWKELGLLSPTDARVQEELGRACIAAGQLGEAERVLGGLADILAKAKQPKVLARVQQALGQLAERQNQPALALQKYEEAYRLDPTQAVVLASLGRLAMQQNDAEKARRYLRSLLLQTFDPVAAGITKSEIYLMLGQLHLAANEGPKARNMWERGLESDPKNVALKDALSALPKA